MRWILSSVLAVVIAVAGLAAQPAVSAAGTAAATGRLGGSDRYETAALISQRAFPDRFPPGEGRVYLARGDVFADALAAGGLTDGPVLLVPSCAAVPQPVVEEIGRLDPASVVALGGPQAVCAKTLTDAAVGRPTSRLAGDDRYETAVAISRHAFPRGPVAEVYLARGDAPDAVAGGVLTAGPILLTPARRLPAVVADEIARLDPARVVALGGLEAVSDTLLRTAAKGRGSSRLAGADRYDTALRIAAYRFPASNRAVYLARGDVYADAVAAGVLTDGPILLLPSGCRALPPAVAEYLTATAPSHVFALGGPNAVCDAALVAAARASSAATPDDGSSPGATAPAPGSTPPSDGQDVALTPQAEVLTPTEQRELHTYDQSTGVVTVDAATGLPGVTVGDVLVAGVTPATPEGLLRRVVGVTDLGEQVAYATTGAALTDVIADTGGPVALTAAPLSVDATAYDGATLDSPTTSPSAATLRPMAATTGSAEVSFTVDQRWVATTGNESDAFRGQGSVDVSGTVATGATADLVVDISWGRVKRLKATLTPYERTSAEVGLEGAFTGNVSTEIGKTTRTYAFAIGPVPVVVTESSGLELSVEVVSEARLSTGVEQYSEVTAGFDYDDGDFAVIAKTDGRAQRTSLDPSGKVSTTVEVGPKTDVKFYGVAGTTTEWGGYFTAGLIVADTETTCNWEAGLRGAVGVVAGVDVLGLHLEKEATTEIRQRVGGNTYGCTLSPPGGGGGTPDALAITTATLPAAYVGQHYQGSVQAAGGTAPYTWTITTGALPSGLTLDASGLIHGTPEAVGTSNFTVSVTDSSGATASKSLTVAVLGEDPDKQIATAIAVGISHSVALTSDGALYAWGENSSGQLGNGTTTRAYRPTPVDMAPFAGKTVTSIAASSAQSLALTSDGSLYAWGENSSGQLGNGTTTDSYRPTPVDMAPFAGKAITSIAAGGYHNLALTIDGTLYAWGENSSGQLGNGTTTDSYRPTPVDMAPFAGKAITSIAAGNAHNLALASDGTLYAWGTNHEGELGIEQSPDPLRPSRVEMTPFGGSSVTSIAAGHSHNLALASDGTLYAWGWNDWGQVGNGTHSYSSPVTRVDVSSFGGSSVTSIAAGAYHNLALASDGTLYAWGGNSWGVLGNGTTNDSHRPTPVDMTPFAGMGRMRTG